MGKTLSSYPGDPVNWDASRVPIGPTLPIIVSSDPQSVRKQPVKWYLTLAFDAAFLVLMLLTVGIPLAVVGWGVSTLHLPVWLVMALMPVWAAGFLMLFAGALGAVRLTLPRLEPGNYPFPGHRQSMAWLFHFALQRLMNQRLWSTLILSFASLRWLLLRALGGKVAYGIQTSNDVLITDPSLLTVGEGSMLAAGTFVAGHLVENGRLSLAATVLGTGVQLMGQVTLAPGVEIGNDTVVGPGTKMLGGVRVGSDVYFGIGCLVYNGVTIGDNVVIGHQVLIEADVTIGEGAVIQAGARLPKGTVVGEGEPYPPRRTANPVAPT
jgi:acetyltransferase-like isoleucine patch superfamily enzyme